MVAMVPRAEDLGVLLSALADPLRRRVLTVVSRNPDAIVTEICNAFEVSRFAIMRHLNVLGNAGMIVRSAVGRKRQVRLSEERLVGVIEAWLAKLRQENDE